MLKGGAEPRKAFLTQATQSDVQAYYPLDTSFKASFEPLMIDPSPPFPGAPGSFKLRQALLKKNGPAAANPFGGPPAGPPDPDAPHLAGQDVNKALNDLIAKGYEDARLANTVPILEPPADGRPEGRSAGLDARRPPRRQARLHQQRGGDRRRPRQGGQAAQLGVRGRPGRRRLRAHPALYAGPVGQAPRRQALRQGLDLLQFRRRARAAATT